MDKQSELDNLIFDLALKFASASLHCVLSHKFEIHMTFTRDEFHFVSNAVLKYIDEVDNEKE